MFYLQHFKGKLFESIVKGHGALFRLHGRSGGGARFKEYSSREEVIIQTFWGKKKKREDKPATGKLGKGVRRTVDETRLESRPDHKRPYQLWYEFIFLFEELLEGL